MNKQEIKLLQRLCSFQAENFDETLLQSATPNVLGQLFFNRMQGVAYGVLQKHHLLGKVNREFRNSLKGGYELNKEKNKSFFQAIRYLFEILKGCDCSYAMLKGALLCGLYPEGYRTSNDIDLLTLPQHVTQIGNLLLEKGFQQGKIRNEQFFPASRKEIIESKMMYGETVPYIKQVDLPGMKYLEVDLNFSLDYKNNQDGVLEKMLENTCLTPVNGVMISTLEPTDFLIHLCSHLYKEASTLPWVEMGRDMALYKYCDIYFLLSQMDKKATAQFFGRAKEFGMEKICGYAVLQTSQLFDLAHPAAVRLAKKALADDPGFLLRVISPKDKSVFAYTTRNAQKRFFLENRLADLKEVSAQ